MLNCPKCGTDNLLTAVFCRGCGEKLDLNAIKPETILAADKTKKKGNDTANMVVGIVLAVAIVVVAVGCLFPVGGRLPGSDNQAAITQGEKLLKSLKTPLTFTDEEASAFINSKLEKFTGDAGVPTPQYITVHFQEDQTVKLILSAKLTILPLHFTVISKPTVPSRGSLNLETVSAKIGLLPLPEGLRPQLLGNFQTVADQTLGSYKKNISKLTIKNGSADFYTSKNAK